MTETPFPSSKKHLKIICVVFAKLTLSGCLAHAAKTFRDATAQKRQPSLRLNGGNSDFKYGEKYVHSERRTRPRAPPRATKRAPTFTGSSGERGLTSTARGTPVTAAFR